jgi:hypothetical protein
MILKNLRVHALRADLAKNNVTLTLTLDLDAAIMAAKWMLGEWIESETPVHVEILPVNEQLSLLDQTNAFRWEPGFATYQDLVNAMLATMPPSVPQEDVGVAWLDFGAYGYYGIALEPVYEPMLEHEFWR